MTDEIKDLNSSLIPHILLPSDTVHQKFGRDDDGRKKSGGGVEKSDARLLADVCQMPEIPCHEIIDFVKRREGDMKRVRDEFTVKNAARNVAFRQDGDL